MLLPKQDQRAALLETSLICGSAVLKSTCSIQCGNKYLRWLLRSEIPIGMCAKLRTAAASNNRDHPTR